MSNKPYIIDRIYNEQEKSISIRYWSQLEIVPIRAFEKEERYNSDVFHLYRTVGVADAERQDCVARVFWVAYFFGKLIDDSFYRSRWADYEEK